MFPAELWAVEVSPFPHSDLIHKSGQHGERVTHEDTIVLCRCCSRWGSENAMKSLLWGSWGSCDCVCVGGGRKNPCKLTF